MLQEAPDEFDGVHGGPARPVTLLLAVGEGAVAILDADDPEVGDGYSEEVGGGKILVGGLAVAHGLGVDTFPLRCILGCLSVSK